MLIIKDLLRVENSVVLKSFGGFRNVKVEKCPLVPNFCKDFDVEVKVHYGGVNFADLYICRGLLRNKLPAVLGLECVGVVTDVGSRVESLKPGQRVLCYQGSGGLYRDNVIVNEKNCFLVPDYIEDEHAVALPASYLTAFLCLFDIGNLRPGNTVLIHSCAGGVGWAATQLARSVNNVTIVGTSSVSKHSIVKDNGVTHVIDSQDYLEELKKSDELREMKFDIIIDTIGCGNIAVSQSLLKPLGKHVIIGVSNIVKGTGKFGIFTFLKMWWNTKNIEISDLIQNNKVVAGFHLDNVLETTPIRVHEVMDTIFQMYQDEKILPRIDSVFPLSEAVEGMKKLAERKNIGKVILKM